MFRSEDLNSIKYNSKKTKEYFIVFLPLRLANSNLCKALADVNANSPT